MAEIQRETNKQPIKDKYVQASVNFEIDCIFADIDTVNNTQTPICNS